MVVPEYRTLIEAGIPIDEVNEYSKTEKGAGGKPPHWEMVFWWTRKPLASARAIIAASLLAEGVERERFLNYLFPCLGERKTVHNCNPSPKLVEKLRGKKLLDPFAGFGSIPLEGMRLGLDVTAVELLPTAYVFLKAVLEYPHRYGREVVEITGREVRELGLEDVAKKFSGARKISDSGKYKVPRLIYDVARWGRWVAQRLREDPDVKELYDEDVAIYIGTWEVKCPAGDHYTPLVGNWWLARVKAGKEYERLAWMTWRDGKIEIVDLNEECRKSKAGNCDKLKAVVKTKGEEEEGGSVEWGGMKFAVPAKNVDGKGEVAKCLHCRVDIDHRYVNGQLKKPVKGRKKEGEWYVKWALRQWNTNLERYLNGEITLQELRNSPARPILLIKVKLKNNDLEFELTSPQDTEKLWKALEKLKQMWGDPDIPYENIQPYGGATLGDIYKIFIKYRNLFNPRQLLTLTKLVKLIREAGKRTEEEELKKGMISEDASKYAEAVATYLAIALCKYADYNSIVNRYRGDKIRFEDAFAQRGIAMTWNFADAYPLRKIGGITGTLVDVFESINEALGYLISAVSGSPNGVRVLLDDATVLSKLGDERYDLIVTDPPYADDVPYAELSDFYYVWLKRALSDSDGRALKPRYLPEAFFDEFGEEIPTQWKVFAPREVSESKSRYKFFNMNVTFRVLLTRAFANVIRYLKEDGLLATYYVAKKPEAWTALIDALWGANDMILVGAYPVETESEESVVARGKASVIGGYVTVWRRRRGEKPLDIDASREAAVAEIAKRLEERLRVIRGKNGSTAWVYSYLVALEYLLGHKPVTWRGVALGSEDLLKLAVGFAFEALLKRSGVEVSDTAAVAYLALKIVSDKNGHVDSDELAHVERAVGLAHVDMAKLGLIREVPTGGPRVAKRKVFRLVAPMSETLEELVSAYHAQRGKSAVLDCLRQLQINALKRDVPVNCSDDVRRAALAFARALVKLAEAGLIKEDDVDVRTAKLLSGIPLFE